jgi:hypothetical protein
MTDEIIRNLGPPVGALLICLLGWLDLRRMRRKRPRLPRIRPRARHPSGRRKND